jgi:glyceraldehyde-3-phosphate dehydrogenase (NAD(P))
MMVVKVAINGYGTIGKRVADAVNGQDDMRIIGVCKRNPTFEVEMAHDRGLPFFTTDEDRKSTFAECGLGVEGLLHELLDEADIVVDCTPGKVGATYLPLYNSHGIKAIFQGGEKADVADVSFNAMANYKAAWGKERVRVVSCNTTGLCRTLYPVYRDIGIEEVLAVLVRRAADPWDSKKGPINAITPSLKLPTHHGPDLNTVIPDINIQSMAVAVPTTIMHLHALQVVLKRESSSEEVIDLWERSPRLKMVAGAEGIKSTAQAMELAKDLGRSRSDLFEIAVWRDGTHVVGRTLYYYQAVHQESDVVPENIDAIRSMMTLEPDPMVSITKTDASLGIPPPRS